MSDLAERFKHHPPPTMEVAHDHGKVRSILLSASEEIRRLFPLSPSHEESLFVTKMEEAMFWANAAVARLNAPGEPGQTAQSD